MIYLTKHSTQAAYDAVKDNLAKPHVALTADNNKVHYIPNSITPPTPSFSIVSVETDGIEVELGDYPYIAQAGGFALCFNRPVSYDELSAITIQCGYDYEECETYQAEVDTEYEETKWGILKTELYEGTTTKVYVWGEDTTIYICNISIQ